MKYVNFYRLKVMLRIWGEELNARDEEVKTTVKGKSEANRYTQTRYLSWSLMLCALV